MVHYIRLLKTPKHNHTSKPSTITTLLTITTDLGDSFLPTDVSLTATLLSNKHEKNADVLLQRQLFWTAGSRQLGVSIPVQGNVGLDGGVRLIISESRSSKDGVVPRIVSAWSAPFGGAVGGEAEKVVERRIRGREDGTGELKVWEEMGNSIALHIWDAALACVLCFQRALGNQNGPMNSLREFSQRPAITDDGEESQSLRVIELGTGCGVVGISLAQMIRNCQVLLTDLPAAEELVSRNMSIARQAEGSSLDFRVLDWDYEDDTGEDIYGSEYDMIVVSDCTYNSDSLPALVCVLKKLVSTSSPRAMVLMALKRRHESEQVLFELMEKAGFWVYDQEVVLLPSLLVTAEDETERVEMFVFRWKEL